MSPFRPDSDTGEWLATLLPAAAFLTYIESDKASTSSVTQCKKKL
jgi:hypothetical protein